MLARKGILPGTPNLKWLVAGAVAAALAAAPALGQPAQGDRVLRAGYAIEAPYAFLGEDGRVSGEAREIARRIAVRLGFARVEWVQTRFGALIPRLKERRFDIVAAGLFITPGRAREVAFSRPTLRARQALLVRAGNPLALHSYEEALARQARIAVIDGLEDRALAKARDGALAEFIGGAEHRGLAAAFGPTGKEIPEAIAAADVLNQ